LYAFQLTPSPSERVAKVGKITTPTNGFEGFFEGIRLNNWFTAGNNVAGNQTIGALAC